MSIKSRAFRYTAILAVIGLILSCLVAYVERSTLDTYARNLPFVSLGDNIKNRSTKGHLWFEELMAGDEGNDIDRDVLSLFVSSKAILTGAMNGTETELGVFHKSDDPKINKLLKNGIEQLDLLIGATKGRWNFRQQSMTLATGASGSGEEAGGNLDVEFDTKYEKVQESMDLLIEYINETVHTDSRYLNSLSWVSIILMGVVFVTLCLQLFRVQNRSDILSIESTAQLEREIKRVSSMSGFIDAVSAGNYDIELTQSDKVDNLTKTLLNMRDKLKQNAESDRQRNWGTEGLAQIGEILRSNTTNTTELYDNIIRFVVKYTGSNQGGMFLLSEEEGQAKSMELVACYAFERKKFLTKKIDVREGLVGQCYLEGQRILMLEVPQEYASITSGLGGSNPNALVLVPMKINEKTYGVLEIASFKKYKDYEIELVEKFSESIASTISTVKINESTRLLLEKTQQQAEDMKSQEEEMRQNLEELNATQEEMGRKEREYIDRIRYLESASAKTIANN